MPKKLWQGRPEEVKGQLQGKVEWGRRGEGCWHRGWQLPTADCEEGEGGPPSGDRSLRCSVKRYPVSRAGYAFL